jgi:hypothetical protein
MAIIDRQQFLRFFIKKRIMFLFRYGMFSIGNRFYIPFSVCKEMFVHSARTSATIFLTSGTFCRSQKRPRDSLREPLGTFSNRKKIPSVKKSGLVSGLGTKLLLLPEFIERSPILSVLQCNDGKGIAQYKYSILPAHNGLSILL